MYNIIDYLNNLFLAFSCLLVLAAVYVQPRQTEELKAGTAGRRHLYTGAMFAAFLLFLALRLWQFGVIPGGFNQDGAMAAVDGKALADYGTDRFGTKLPAHLYGWGFGQMSSLLSYLIAPNVKLFGLSEVTARLPQLLTSVMGGVCFVLFVRDAFGRRAGLLAAFLLAVNPWHLLQSRWALDCNLLPHFFMAGIYFLHRGLTVRRGFIYLSMVFFGLSMYGYGVSIYTVTVFILVMGLILCIKKQLSITEHGLCALIYLLVSWPFILTMMINTFGWKTVALPFVTMQYFDGSVRAGDILFFSADVPAQLVTNIKAFFNVVILQKKDLPWNDMPLFGTMYLFALPFAFPGLYSLIKTKSVGGVLALGGLLTGVWAGICTNSVNINRVNLVFYFVLLLIVLGIGFVIDRLRYGALPAGVMFLLAALVMSHTYFTTYADSISRSFYYGFGEALSAAKESGAERIYITADTQYEGSRNVSEILTLFYDETDAEYYQGRREIEGLLPYSERIVYLSMDENTSKIAEENSAFVIKLGDEQYFDAEKYSLSYYGDYACVTEK